MSTNRAAALVTIGILLLGAWFVIGTSQLGGPAVVAWTQLGLLALFVALAVYMVARMRAAPRRDASRVPPRPARSLREVAAAAELEAPYDDLVVYVEGQALLRAGTIEKIAEIATVPSPWWEVRDGAVVFKDGATITAVQWLDAAVDRVAWCARMCDGPVQDAAVRMWSSATVGRVIARVRLGDLERIAGPVTQLDPSLRDEALRALEQADAAADRRAATALLDAHLERVPVADDVRR